MHSVRLIWNQVSCALRLRMDLRVSILLLHLRSWRIRLHQCSQWSWAQAARNCPHFGLTDDSIYRIYFILCILQIKHICILSILSEGPLVTLISAFVLNALLYKFSFLADP